MAPKKLSTYAIVRCLSIVSLCRLMPSPHKPYSSMNPGASNLAGGSRGFRYFVGCSFDMLWIRSWRLLFSCDKLEVPLLGPITDKHVEPKKGPKLLPWNMKEASAYKEIRKDTKTLITRGERWRCPWGWDTRRFKVRETTTANASHLTLGANGALVQ